MTTTQAAIWEVQVSNFQFSPSTVTANVGDIIRFQWSSGFHTTTSTSVPGGASAWDNPINSGNLTFDYTLQVQGTYQYDCTFHPSMTGTINVGAALPVKFGELITQENTAGRIAIKWQSYTESNLASYTVKRSIDGSKFDDIGLVQVKASTNGSNQYSFTDEKTVRSQRFYYYYVEATDKDGKKTLSGIKLHRTKSSNADIIASISPNPITRAGHLNLKFNAESPGKMELILFDNSGKAIKQTMMQAAPGVNNGHWHLGELTPGKYLLQCQLGNIKETKEIIVIQ
jgi:plastocyanin